MWSQCHQFMKILIMKWLVIILAVFPEWNFKNLIQDRHQRLVKESSTVHILNHFMMEIWVCDLLDLIIQKLSESTQAEAIFKVVEAHLTQ